MSSDDQLSANPRSITGVIAGDRHFSFDQFFARARRGATALADRGVSAGDSVGLMLRNDVAFLEASFAAAYVGGSPTPINWHYTGQEAQFIIRDSGITALVIHESLRKNIAHAIPPSLPILTVCDPPEIAMAYDTGSGTAPGVWDAAVLQSKPWDGEATGNPAATVYTSGTTGRPKGVRRLALQNADDARESSKAMGLAPGMRTVIAGPLYHSGPNVFGINAIRMGGLVVLHSKFDAERLLQAIERFAITHLQLVPTMFTRLLRVPDNIRRRYDLSSLQKVVHTAAPCPPAVKQAMIDWWGPVIHELYAGTELGPVAASTSEEWQTHRGTVGRPLPRCTVKILDESGHTLGPNDIGDIYVRNAYSDFTYHRRVGDREKIERDGFVTCGDMGYLDDDGFLYVCDRRTDMVISGGVNIYPAEIEACIFSNPDVLDCAVYGIPDDEFGESLVAAIKMRPDVAKDADRIRQHIRRQLAGFKVPKIIDFVDDFPRDDSGKVFKRQLRAEFDNSRKTKLSGIDETVQS